MNTAGKARIARHCIAAGLRVVMVLAALFPLFTCNMVTLGNPFDGAEAHLTREADSGASPEAEVAGDADTNPEADNPGEEDSAPANDPGDDPEEGTGDDTGGVEPDAVVTLAAILGVAPPVSGEAPVAVITETAEYTGVVSWSPNDNPFGVFSAYTATITLTVKSGYTLSGVPENFFTVEGATSVGNAADTGVVTAAFPETGGYAIGATGPAGGIVFYENPAWETDGWRYLEVWTEDETGEFQWKTSATLSDPTSTAIGGGFDNTYTALVGPEHPAAQVAREATHGESNDWFLPSRLELNEVYLNRSVIGEFRTDLQYWSSSDTGTDTAAAQSFENGSIGGMSKTNLRPVRVIRRFTP